MKGQQEKSTVELSSVRAVPVLGHHKPAIQEMMAWQYLLVCRLVLLLWTLVTAHPEALDRPECPRSCSCSFTQWFVQCSNASFSSLPADVPHATVELDLQFNQLGSLPAASFPSLPELTTLYLGSSRVRFMEPGTFQGVDNLYHLYLDNNLLEEIPAGVFGNMTNLVFLHLQHNRITSLSPGAFSSLKKLSVLDLSHNLLAELSDKCLGGLQQLRQLRLSSNLIANMSVRALPGSLRTLYLDRNRLRSVPAAVCNSVTLSSLYLSGNPIEDLTALSLGRKLGSLRQLFLENLPLENIASASFKKLRRLEVLSLRNNSLETLPSLSFLKYLSTLYLSGNRWRCDCSLIWLRTWQKKVARKDRNPVECSSPDALQGHDLVDIELQKLTCPPYQTKSDVSRPSANIPMATTPFSVSQVATTFPVTVFATLTTSRITSTIKSITNNVTHDKVATGPTTHNNHHTLDNDDPCLSNHIINISTRTKGSNALLLRWTSSGDHDQFEVRCTSSMDRHILRVIGGLREIELHHLQPETTYRVCIVPQNENLVECVTPTAQQCALGHTGVHFLSQHSKLALGTGVTITLLILVALALFAFYKWQFRPIQFQRHFDEDGSFPQHQDLTQSKLTTESIYESLEDGQHVYVTTGSQWCEETIDYTSTSPSRFSSTPTYSM